MCFLLLVLKHGLKHVLVLELEVVVPQEHHIFRVGIDPLRLLDDDQLIGFLSIVKLFIFGDVPSRSILILVIVSDKDSVDASSSFPLLDLQGAANRTHPYVRV